jgi:hypothetical protein
MHKRTGTILFGSTALAVSLIGMGHSFAVEPGDFQATLRGATMGVPLGAAPPPGLYFDVLTFIGPNGVGVGQNSAAAGADNGKGLTVFGEAIAPALVWSTGWNFLGANPTFAVIQPLYTVAGLQTDGGAGAAPPFAFGNGAFFENVHNTIWSSSLSWNLGSGWHASAGFNFQGPDGSQYNGTLNQDYWTFSPTLALAYLTKDWKVTANFDYDIHTASAGHTGTYAALATIGAIPTSLAQEIGDGYTTGNQAFLDWTAAYKVGKWSFGPTGYFKWQTTSDSPGSGLTCAQVTAMLGPSLSCGSATDVALGAMLGYNLGIANFEVYVTDSVYTRDDFSGVSVFTRLSFKLWPDEPPPASRPMYTKAN